MMRRDTGESFIEKWCKLYRSFFLVNNQNGAVLEKNSINIENRDQLGTERIMTYIQKQAGHKVELGNKKPLTQWLREAKRSMRIAGLISITTVIHAALFPHFAMAQAASDQREAAERIVLQGTPEQQLNQALLKVQEIADSKQRSIADRLAEESGLLNSVLDFFGLSQLQLEEINNLEQLNTLLFDLNETAMDQFQVTETDLRDKGLPEEILQRHLAMVGHYQEQFTALSNRLTAVLQAEDLQAQSEAMTALDQLMEPQKLKRSHQTVDPNKLPWGTPDAGKVREPARTAEELNSQTGISPIPEGIQIAAHTLPSDIFELVGGPLPQDLAETPDIQITDAIRDLAENQLGDDPVAIYNWVRNNIEYIPSYGSIQGADYTLQHGKGNAFDTASLLIALFRASNIPARYAYGTVQVPVEKVMNWVGGVDVPEAAQQLLGQGGIPNVGQINGGRITHIEMEHVWVEAWVDYFPSRGTKHAVGDQWIPLDASFKQYDFTSGYDLEENVPFDGQSLVDTITRTATVDETAGFVQGVDQAAIETALADYQQQIADYINNQNPDATMGEVLGIQRVIVQEYQQLAAGLPYKLIARTHNYSSLPSSLRHQFRYTLAGRAFGLPGPTLISFEQSLPELAGKKHALSFRPATQSDEDTINSYLPEPDPVTGEIDINQLPSTLPGYLINLVAEFTQDGVVIESASAGVMGTELRETLALWSPSFGWNEAVNNPAAGEYRAIGLSLQGVNPEELTRLQIEIEDTQSILESGNAGQVSSLAVDERFGNLLYSAIFSYMYQTYTQDKVQAELFGVVNYRLPSYGVFSTELQASYFFGVPRDVGAVGLSIDVDRLAAQSIARNNDRQVSVSFVRSAGIRSSAMEHIVPESIFSSEEYPAQGISAVKALSIAGSQGQRIWTIDQNNLSEALESINLSSEIENQIRNAVLAGKIATTHEQPIDFAAGVSAGYLLVDPDTGAGGYLLENGTNGGYLETALPFLLLVLQRVLPASLIVAGALLSLFLSLRSLLNDLQGCGGGTGLAMLGIGLFVLLFAVSFISVGWAIAAAFAGTLASYGIPAINRLACRAEL